MRLLEVLAGHAAVAVENASLYESARREAESATSLLEFGRELATLVDLDDIVGAGHRALGGDPRQPQHVLLPRDGRRADARRVSTGTPRRSPRSSLRGLCRSRPCDVDRDPFIAEAKDYEPKIGWVAPVPGGRYAVAPFDVDGRDGLPRGPRRAARTSASASCALLGGLAQQAKLAIANASSYEGLERTFVSTVEALANALEANDEYTSHPRALDHGPLTAGRPRARSRRAHAEAPRARRAAPRHRQDRHPERRALEARPTDCRRANSSSRRIRSSASGSSPRSTGSRSCGRSSATATSAGTAAAIPTASPARTSRSSRGSSSSATRTTR